MSDHSYSPGGFEIHLAATAAMMAGAELMAHVDAEPTLWLEYQLSYQNSALLLARHERWDYLNLYAYLRCMDDLMEHLALEHRAERAGGNCPGHHHTGDLVVPN